MKMVAASKLYRTMDAQRRADQFYNKLEDMLGQLAGSVDHRAHPLLQPRPPVKRVLVVVFTSDKGLCGGFNNNLIKHMSRWLNLPDQQVKKQSLSFVGRRGWLFFRNRIAGLAKLYENVTAQPHRGRRPCTSPTSSRAFLDPAIAYDEVYLGLQPSW